MKLLLDPKLVSAPLVIFLEEANTEQEVDEDVKGVQLVWARRSDSPQVAFFKYPNQAGILVSRRLV